MCASIISLSRSRTACGHYDHTLQRIAEVIARQHGVSEVTIRRDGWLAAAWVACMVG